MTWHGLCRAEARRARLEKLAPAPLVLGLDHRCVLRGDVRLATLITPRVQLKLLLAGEFHE